MLDLIISFFSIKKITHRYVSVFSIWNKNTTFEKTSALRKGSICINSHIGKYSSVGSYSKLINTTIGNYTVIARESRIGLGPHPLNLLTPHSIFYKNNPWGFHPEWVAPINFIENKPIIIGSDVWVGSRAIIMDGIKIGNGAIIAAGSVVTKDVPPFAIVGGAPAKLIRYRFPNEVIKRLQEIEWWNLSDDKIFRVLDLFHIENPTLDDINTYFPEKN